MWEDEFLVIIITIVASRDNDRVWWYDYTQQIIQKKQQQQQNLSQPIIRNHQSIATGLFFISTAFNRREELVEGDTNI